MGCTGSKNVSDASCAADGHKAWKGTKDMSDADFEKMVNEIFHHCDQKDACILEQEEFKQFALHIIEASAGLELANAQEDIQAMFIRFDANKDGKLDWDEVWKCVKPLKANM